MATKESLIKEYISDIKNTHSKSEKVKEVINEINGLYYSSSEKNLTSGEKKEMLSNILEGLIPGYDKRHMLGRKLLIKNSNEHYLELWC